SILHKLASAGDEGVRAAALQTLELDHKFRLARAETAARRGGRLIAPVTFSRIGGQPSRTIYDQQHHTRQTPGKVDGERASARATTRRSIRRMTVLGLRITTTGRSFSATRSTRRGCRCWAWSITAPSTTMRSGITRATCSSATETASS